MADRPLHKAMRRTLLKLQGAADLPDGDLLQRFVADRDEAAFEALVRRHGPMVLRVCRRVLRDAHDAEEAFQATFIVLVRKADAIGRGELIGGWLHGVATRVALKARARSGRDRVRPVDAADLDRVAEAGNGDAATGDLRPVLDEELGRLPEKYRTPLVLCYLEGKTNQEAAHQLGWAKWTTATRLARGRDLLRRRLARRGLEFTAVALTAVLTQESIAATEANSTVVILKLSTAATTDTAGSVAAGLAGAAIRTLFWSRVRSFAAVTAAAMLLVAGGAGIAWRVGREGSSSPAVVDASLGVNASLDGRRLFPNDSPWNQEIADEPLDPNSAAIIARIGADKPLLPRFGAATGIPYTVVAGDQARVPVRFRYETESDAGPYPILANAPLEVGRDNRALVILDRDAWKLYELLEPTQAGSEWKASCGAVFDLNSSRLRPWGATSADGAGLPIFAGLVRRDEIERGEIRHALRFTVGQTRRAFVAPARHYASKLKDADLPPMGLRVRLRADYDVSSFPPNVRVILTALQRYGMFVAAHGPDWGLSGTADPRWDDAELRALERVRGADFEVVRMGKIHSTEMPPPGER